MPVSNLDMQCYFWLLRLYPQDVRHAYGQQLQDSFRDRIARVRQRGLATLALTVAKDIAFLLIDIAAERVAALYSHRSFHGRCEPDLGVVRPPNMSKAEWFGSERPKRAARNEPATFHRAFGESERL
jgi:hypothetical protein